MTGPEVASGSAPVESEPIGPIATDLSAIPERLAEAEADALVVVGDRFDSDLQYLSRIGTFDGRAAIAVSEDAAVVSPPNASGSAARARERFVEAAERAGIDDGISRSVRTNAEASWVGERAASIVADLVGDGADVVVPRTLAHDAAVHLEEAGHAIASTTAVREARAVKSDAEIDRIRRVQSAAVRGMDRTAAVLADAEIGPSDTLELRSEGEPLSSTRLRREANAAMALAGVDAAGNTTVRSTGTTEGPESGGEGDADADDIDSDDREASGRSETLRAGEPIVIALAPRGPDGYHGALARTFVVDADGGWERRAHLALESAREAGIDAVSPGVRASILREEVDAELGAYGFDSTANGSSEPGGTGVRGHGVGLSLREPPALSATTDLRIGSVLALDASVGDPAAGRVRLRDLLVVTRDGAELLDGGSTAIVPRS